MSSNNLDKSLIDYLQEIPDERNLSGKRHPLWLILSKALSSKHGASAPSAKRACPEGAVAVSLLINYVAA
jgi:hypothetical protein